MTREDFKALWNINELECSTGAAMKYVKAEVKYQDDDILLNFDLFTEDEVYASGYDFFRQLKDRLPELDDFAKKKIIEQDLNWNDIELKLSEIRFRKEGYYHAFALTYYGGEVYDDECYDSKGKLIDDSCPDLLTIHICFDQNFEFAEGFNESEMID